MRRLLADSERRGVLLLLLPYLLGLLGLIGIPAGFTAILSLFEYDLLRPPEFIGLGNFSELLGDGIFHAALLNSLGFVLLAVPLRLLGALGVGLLLHKPFRGAGFYRAAIYLPTVIPEIAYALIWIWLLNPLYGPINLMLGTVGLPTPAWFTDPAAARWGVILLSTFTIGEGFLVAMAARRLIPGELYELAAVERGGPIAVFRHITLPLMAPTLLLLLARDVIFSLQITLVPALVIFGGGPPPNGTTYLPFFIYRNGFEYLRYGYAAAATLIMFLVTAAVILVQVQVLRGLTGAADD
ncbi:MAG TPA: sugar ABC transporter permease [Candidatus Limnocylindrales bacterium]|nr:sugar ABC transporter permease [Candidatus Limnocylindrales bacterium]